MSKGKSIRNKNKIDRIKFHDILLFVVLLGLTITFIIPVALIYVISLSSNESIRKLGYTLFPSEWSLDGYRYLMGTSEQLINSAFISVFITVAGTILSVIVMGMVAYVIYRKDFKYRVQLSFFIFFTMLFSGGMVPSYIINTRLLHLNDTILILFLPFLCRAWHVIILRTYYTQSIPDSLIEAAKIDGARELELYFKIVFPISLPGIATIALYSVVLLWNEWFTGLLYINNSKLLPLQVLLHSIQSDLDVLSQNPEFATSPDGIEMAMNLPADSARMALAVVIMTPVLFAYPFFQRYFIKGLTIGSVKG